MYPTLTVLFLLQLSLDAHALLHVSEVYQHKHFIARVFETGEEYLKVCGTAEDTEPAQAVLDTDRLKKGPGIKGHCMYNMHSTKQRKWMLGFIQPIRIGITIYFSGEEHN